MTDAEREMWQSWWAKATPEQRRWALSVSGKPMVDHEFTEDDEGRPTGMRRTGGHMPRFDLLFNEEDAEI